MLARRSVLEVIDKCIIIKTIINKRFSDKSKIKNQEVSAK